MRHDTLRLIAAKSRSFESSILSSQVFGNLDNQLRFFIDSIPPERTDKQSPHSTLHMDCRVQEDEGD